MTKYGIPQQRRCNDDTVCNGKPSDTITDREGFDACCSRISGCTKHMCQLGQNLPQFILLFEVHHHAMHTDPFAHWKSRFAHLAADSRTG